MCCGRGIKTAASKQYTTPSSPTIVTTSVVDTPVVRKIPDYPMPKKIGAYYGNPVKKSSNE